MAHKTSRLLAVMIHFCIIVPGVWGSTHYVWTNSPSPSAPYSSWSTAAHVIQDAVNAASPGDTVLATNGVYSAGSVTNTYDYGEGNRVALTNAVTLCSVNGPLVTTIVGSQDPTLPLRCVFLGTNAMLTGFTITGGAVGLLTSAGFTKFGGGGVYGRTAADFSIGGSIVSNCVISNCISRAGYNSFGGGVIYCTVIDSQLINNSSYIDGGGASFSDLRRCRIVGNAAKLGGGLSSCNATDCVITNNHTTSGGNWSEGGGADGSYLVNCLVAYNSVIFGSNPSFNSYCLGGGIYSSTARNCTIINNTAAGGCDGVSKSTLTNCIVYFNGTQNYDDGASILGYCCTYPMPTTNAMVSSSNTYYNVGDITTAPSFLNYSGGDFHLAAGSSCIDAGTSVNAPTTDLDGTPRPLKGSPSSSALFDIGAYEYASSLVDFDHDGASDYAEVVAGTNPLDSNSVFRITSITPATGHVTITWPSVASSAPTAPTRYYTVQYNTNNLSNASWINEPDSLNVIGTGSTLSYTTSSLSTNQALRVSVHW